MYLVGKIRADGYFVPGYSIRLLLCAVCLDALQRSHIVGGLSQRIIQKRRSFAVSRRIQMHQSDIA